MTQLQMNKESQWTVSKKYVQVANKHVEDAQ